MSVFCLVLDPSKPLGAQINEQLTPKREIKVSIKQTPDSGKFLIETNTEQQFMLQSQWKGSEVQHYTLHPIGEHDVLGSSVLTCESSTEAMNEVRELVKHLPVLS